MAHAIGKQAHEQSVCRADRGEPLMGQHLPRALCLQKRVWGGTYHLKECMETTDQSRLR